MPPIQSFDYRESAYERPTQAWLCGHLADGRPCRIGPDRRGHCRASFECQPVKHGDRWHCTRPAAHGGPCTDGPRPDGDCRHPIATCQPIRSARAKRALAARWLVALTIGAILVAFTGPAATRLVEPGARAFVHADIGDCKSCHSLTTHGPVAWLIAAFAPGTPNADSRLCLSCHRFGDNGLSAHNLAPAGLAPVTERIAADSVGRQRPILSALGTLAVAPPAPDQAHDCATCHSEHRGRQDDLTEIANLRCQSCHVIAFTAFADDHPPITQYPYARRTRVVFDHVSHIAKHFKDQAAVDAPTACTGCHQLDPAGQYMLVKGFDQACASCHLGQIEGEGRASAKGVAVLGVPALDTETLRAAGAEIGSWPDDADGAITPFMAVLLASDPIAVADLLTLSGVDLADLRDAEAEGLAAAARTAWAIKLLIYDLGKDGHRAIGARLERALARKVADTALGPLSGLMSQELVQQATKDWFPGLAREVPAFMSGALVAVPEAGLTSPERAPAPVAPEPPSPPPAADDGLLDGGLLDGGLLDGGLLDAEPPPRKSTQEPPQDENLLGDGGLLAEPAPTAADAKPATAVPAVPRVPVEVTPIEDEASAPLDAETWARGGGWYRRDWMLHYRPAGHSDGFLRNWIEIAGAVRPAPGTGAALGLFAALTAAKAPGVCAKCHGIEATSDGALMVNWRTQPPDVGDNRFTFFAHRPHFGLLDEKGCLTCHALDPEAPYLKSFETFDPLLFASNFKPMDKQVCGQCHVHERAGERCIDCHNYHIGRFPPALAGAPLGLPATGGEVNAR